jgi:hypothetical protein
MENLGRPLVVGKWGRRGGDGYMNGAVRATPISPPATYDLLPIFFFPTIYHLPKQRSPYATYGLPANYFSIVSHATASDWGYNCAVLQASLGQGCLR